MALFKNWFGKKDSSPLHAEAPRAPVQEAPRAATHAPTAAPAPEAAALARVKNVIAIASGKGGVGKSTVTTNLALALRSLGFTVGVLDADIYGPSQTGMLGAQGAQGKTTPEGALIPINRHGIPFISMGVLMGDDRPLVWRAPMAMQVIHQFLKNVQWGALDFLLVDLPPGTGDVQLTLAQNARLSGAVIVTTPQDVALGIAKKGLEMFRQLNIPILGVIENMSGFTCSHCGHETAIFKEGGGARLALDLKVPFLGAIPLDPEIMSQADSGIPLFEAAPHSDSAQSFLKAAQNTQKELRALKEDILEPQSYEVTSDRHSFLLRWKDGTNQKLSAYSLRAQCGCASCIDEHTGKRILDVQRISPQIEITQAQSVGRYALTFGFTDGHNTGIYPYSKLREHVEIQPSADRPSAAQPTVQSGSSSISSRIEKVLDEQINPGVASHGGKIELVKFESGTAYLKMSGGCQGCGAAQHTLKDGVERALRAQIPEIQNIVDTTQHHAGKNPYFAKGASTPAPSAPHAHSEAPRT